MNGIKQLLEDLEMMDSLLTFPIVIRNHRVLIKKDLRDSLLAIGIELEAQQYFEFDVFSELLAEKGISIDDLRTIRIIRKIVV
ncbi:hypothetical protein [Croceitalea rosinachiae]|uniref:Uncharacterized protein n=1 Tax=Croceitalea rosinachiae TaxID=3075596 RepID=A0ABU3AEQ7_9FLAO|nr:hypothetical protein [Croceitalea sp. F388]MDT0608012.1 hypothetical protein [Croceitalea sp. F388]